MATLTITGDSVIFQSALKFSDIQTLLKFRPEALKIMSPARADTPPEILFQITLGEKPSVTQFGAVFPCAVPDTSKPASITRQFPIEARDAEDITEWAYEKYGISIQRLTEIEDAITKNRVLGEIAESKEKIISNIKIV